MKKRTVIAMLLVIAVLALSLFTLTGCQPTTVTKTVTEKVDKVQVVREAAATWLKGVPTEGELTSRVIKIADLQTRINAAGTDFVIIDIRTADDFAKGHINGATNIPYRTIADQASVNKLPKGKLIVVVCYSGLTAAQTSAIWGMMGYDTAALVGGMTTGSTLPQATP